ncbi:MAG: hypothetical protein V1706_08115 [Pseudomonadota bacterium]
MLIIRKQQMHAFQSAPRQRFENSLVDHFIAHYPVECALLDNDQILQFIRAGIAKASNHGFSTQRETGLFLGIMFILGSHFDTDPQFSWAMDALNDPLMPDSYERIRQAYAETVDYLENVAGKDNQLIVKALIRLKKLDITEFDQIPEDDLQAKISESLQYCYPEKYEYQGQENVDRLIKSSMVRAAKYGIDSHPGKATFAALSFMLGENFDIDPLQPWAAQTLSDDSENAHMDKTERLYLASLQHIEHSLSGY